MARVINLLPYTVRIQQDPFIPTNVVTFPSETDTYGRPTVEYPPQKKLPSLHCSGTCATKSGGVVECPVISPILLGEGKITGMKIPWSEIPASIIVSEEVARSLASLSHSTGSTGSTEPRGGFKFVIYVPDVSTAHHDFPADPEPESFQRFLAFWV